MDYRPGADIFETGAECIVNPVNCQVHKLFARHAHSPRGRTAQQGLAGAFETRFPDIQNSLGRVCEKGLMKPGMVQMVPVDRASGLRSKTGDLFIANMATKDYWADPSRIEWVDAGLGKLAAAIEARGIRSVAIPMLGAGLGKLPWADVRASVEKHFKPLAERGVSVTVLGEGPERERSGAETRASERPQLADGGPVDINAFMEEMRGHQAPFDGPKTYAGIGSRETPDTALKKMTDLAEILAEEGWTLRSGGAKGADSAFEEGARRVKGASMEIFLPWNGFQPDRDIPKKRFAGNRTVFVPEASKLGEEIARAYHPRFDSLTRGAKSLMMRNGNQMFGKEFSRPSDLVIAWTVDGKAKGGTGQAIRLSEDLGVPVLNLGDPRVRDIDTPGLAKIARGLVSGQEMKDLLPVRAEPAKLQEER